MPQLTSARWIASLLLLQSVLALAGTVGGTPGNDGPNLALTGTVNTYFPGTSATASGTTAITLGTSRGAATAIAAGDLLIIIQMQDATINSTNTVDYGDGAGGNVASGATSNGQSGLYEYIVATSAVPVGGGTLNFLAAGTGGALLNSYFNANANATQGQRRYQIVRVPQYSSATMTGTVTAAAWDGSSGGIVALDIAGAFGLNGQTINVQGLGFRGGGARQVNGTTAAGFADTDYCNVAPPAGTVGVHASKGEGTAGTPRYVYTAAGVVTDLTNEGYPNGSFGRGAPGTAGGGGSDGSVIANEQNSGGGGGGNGAAGGKGGDCWNSQEPYGGLGGALFAAAPARMVMGGGGGAGTRNNSAGVQSSGAPGGGMIFVQCNSVSSTGTLNANGLAGVNADNDGAGGGGAGGSVLFFCNSAIPATLTITANGGDGGDSWPTQAAGGTPGERHGPGGGGGGGVIYRSPGTVTATVNAGLTGTTTSSNSAFGATAGTTSTNTLATLTASQIPGAIGGYGYVPVLTVLKTTSTPFVEKLNNTTALATYTITVTNVVDRTNALAVNISDLLPQDADNSVNERFSYTSTSAITLTGGAVRISTTNPTAGTQSPAWGVFTIPGGASVQITFVVTIGQAVNRTTYNNPATATYLDPRRTTPTGTTTASYNSASSTGEDVTLLQPFTITAANLATVDNDGDGCLDAIRVTCTAGLTLNDNFSALTITVAGYTVTGYATDLLAGGANDNVFYVLLQENTFDLINGPFGDTGNRPAFQVVANNSLIETAGTDTILDTTAALTPADGALPVLVACDWVDGSGGGVSATDFLYLRMSENVTTTNVLISHLALPVTGDTLDATSLVQNVTASNTITVQLMGQPLFSPGGLYSVSALAAGSPSGIMINNGVNIRDASNQSALNQTFGTAVDIRPGNIIVGIAWSDLTTSARVWNIGVSDVATASTAFAAFPPSGLIVRNTGNVRSKFSAVCSVAAPALWTPAATAGINQFEMKASVAGPPYSVYSLDLSVPRDLGTQLYSGANIGFDLRFVTPTEITSGAAIQQEITVTITVTQD